MCDAPAPTQSQLAEQFMARFNVTKSELSKSIASLSTESPIDSSNDVLTSISNEIQKLSKTLHDAALFLPSYSIKMRQNEIRELEKGLKEKEDLLIPKKKFGFKSKGKPTVVEDVDKCDSTKEISSPASEALDKEEKASIASIKAHSTLNFNHVTVEGLKDTSVVLHEEKLNGFDVLVRDLENVTVHLHGSPSTLRITNVKNCKLLCGPVRTSIFVENSEGSILFLCCQQLRTHSSKNTDIYLRVRSRAIIEDCTSIRFGPYDWNHPRSVDLHELAEIGSDMQRFDAVDDFNWLSASQSPNWSILPEEDRITSFPAPQVS